MPFVSFCLFNPFKKMCYNWHVSLVAAMCGYAAAFYVWKRRFSARDLWHAPFLATFVTMQTLEFILWHYATLQPSSSSSLSSSPPLPCERINHIVTKYFVPLVLALEPVSAAAGGLYAAYNMDTTTTRTGLVAGPGPRKYMARITCVYLLIAMLGCVFISATAECSTITPMGYIQWSAWTNNYWLALGFAFIMFIPTLVFMRPLVIPIIGSLYTVAALTLAHLLTDAAGSNWCIFSVFLGMLYICDPWIVHAPFWNKGKGKGKGNGKDGKDGKDHRYEVVVIADTLDTVKALAAMALALVWMATAFYMVHVQEDAE